MILEQVLVNQSLLTFGNQCFAEAFQATPCADYSSVFIISQPRIWELHGDKVLEALDVEVPEAHRYMMPDGEQYKNLETFAGVLDWLAGCRADRKSVIIVLGGGVVGDLSGFVASSWMRGCHWIYIPTTLLAQQDASIGGKTAVNLPQGKNLVGAFWEPRAVILDSSVLSTLPVRQLHAGYMEFLKHGVLDSEALFEEAAELPVEIDDWAPHMGSLVRGCKVKVRIVEEDPLEQNVRRLLNLGHTYGHALESYTGYKEFLHGEAVGVGMIFASLLARRLGSDYDWKPLVAAVKKRLPPSNPSSWDMNRLLDLTILDKKGIKGVVAWIIPFAPGKVEIVKGVDREHLEAAHRETVALLES